MKKISCLFGLMAVALSVNAAQPTYVEFSSEGPDVYADGTDVMVGEVYALVWTKAAAFAGFNADGTLVNDADKLVCALPIAKARPNGGTYCPPVVVTLKNPEQYAGGNFSVYLLDTRVNVGEDEVVSGVTAQGLSRVNKVSAVDDTLKVGEATPVSGAVELGAAVATGIPANVPAPRITGIQVLGSKVIVKVADTVPFLNYTITGGKTPSKIDQVNLVRGVAGAGASEEITLVVEDAQENRFFKVTREK